MKEITRHFRTTLTIATTILAISIVGANAATFTVTNTNDDGAGSLRDAVTQANTNAQEDTINFDPAVFNVARTITLTSGEINISADGQISNGQTGRLVTINGPGANLLTISGNNASRIFLLGPGQNANVTMNGMTLRDGNGVSNFRTANGGAIYAQAAANLTLNSMVIRNNTVVPTGTDNGLAGGIYTNSVRSFVTNNSLITENTARVAGGVYIASSTTTMLNTVVSNNSANDRSGGMEVFNGTHIIKNCQFTGNRAGVLTGGSGANGGLSYFQANLDMSDTTISNNAAGLSVTGGSVGGIIIDIANNIITLRRVTISNNTAKGTVGGIYIRNPSSIVTIIDSTVSNNSVGSNSPGATVSYGGGIYVFNEGSTSGRRTRIINSTISGNSADRRGGGIYILGFDLELINSTVVNNSAGGAGGAGGGGGGIYDGRLGVDGTFLYRPKLQNSIIAGNTAATGPDLYSGFDSAGYNIIGNTANTNNSTANTGDQFNVNPQVGALANNGGATRTHALLAGSPAINAGSNALAVDQNGAVLPYDQRGACFRRIIGGTVDIGAFEFGAAADCPNRMFDFDGDGKSDIRAVVKSIYGIAATGKPT